jgi:hypothetical protein
MNRLFLKRLFLKTAVFSLILSLGACSSLPFYVSSKKGWSSHQPRRGFAGIVRLGTVLVDKNSGWSSVEWEIADLVPLLFLEKGYGFSFDGENADYRAEVHAFEREYTVGWRTRRSVTVELMVWKEGGTLLTAGRAAAVGGPTLSSSKHLNRLLRAALGKALRALRVLKYREKHSWR